MSMTEYHHLINCWVDGFNIPTLQSIGKMSMVNPVTCLFSLFEALNDAFERQFFSGLHVYTISQTLIAW